MKPVIPRFQPGIPLGELLKSFARVVAAPNRHGALTREFEERFSRKLSSRHALAVSSVRFGLFHALKHLGLPPGSEVLCTPITVFPVVETLLLAGLKPVFVEMKKRGFTADLDDADRQVTPMTRVMLVTHLWGVPNDMTRIMEFAGRHNLVVFEDASQCLNGTVGGRKVGTFGKAGFFSLGITKTMNAYGGAVMVTDDPRLYDSMKDVVERLPPAGRARIAGLIGAELALYVASRRIVFGIFTAPLLRLLRQAGVGDRFSHRRLKPGDRLAAFPESLMMSFTDIQAATALRMLDRVDEADKTRREIAECYNKAFGSDAAFVVPEVPTGAEGNYWMYVAIVDSPEELRELLRKEGVDSALTSLDACHEMDYFNEHTRALPVASELARRALYLPNYPAIRGKGVERVIAAVLRYRQGMRG